MKYILVLFLCCFATQLALGQSSDTLMSDALPTVVVKAYQQDRPSIEVAAGVNRIGKALLQRFDVGNLVPVLNATAGVRMEERSPGSYRLNIRGSSLRSPFGVRNVKVYLNDLPFSDVGGTTYLNQLALWQIGNIEVLKGPGSSLYGAGTGGVVLVNSAEVQRVQVLQTAGSYGSSNTGLAANIGSDSLQSSISFQHQQANSYRNHSAMTRRTALWQTRARNARGGSITGFFLLGKLNYQTPGALTLTEYNANPAASRPGAGASPSAVTAQAAINQSLMWGGLRFEQPLTPRWKMSGGIYGSYTKLINPAIRNYSTTNAPGFGGRVVLEWKQQRGDLDLSWQSGIETQQGSSSVQVYSNKQGNADTLQTDDNITLRSYLGFGQLNVGWKKWMATVGIGINSTAYEFQRMGRQTRNYDVRFGTQVSPRITLLRKINQTASVYAVWSRGFSPPTTDEMFATGSLPNPTLAPEQGNNIELGMKGYWLNRRLTADVSVFYFSLNNTIVQRRDGAGGDYYINAGNTRQPGGEVQLHYTMLQRPAQQTNVELWSSYAFYRFSYGSFIQLNNDFSGKRLPGTPTHFLTTGIDIRWRHCYLYGTLQHSSAMPLNDANTDHAAPYYLLSTKLAYRWTHKQLSGNIFAGGDNLLNQQYSAGNDINAFGGRYYNAAMPLNWFAGVTLSVL